MTKSERLLFLIRLMRGHKGVSLKEMSARCDVSPRTLYRDFRTLSRLNYPIRFDKGYHLAKGAHPTPMGISVDEIQMIRLALRLAPLGKYPWLRRELFTIDTKLSVSVSDQIGVGQKPLVSLEDEFRFLAEIPSPSLVEKFFRAVQKKRRVIFIPESGEVSSPMIPEALGVAADGLFFRVSSPGKEEQLIVNIAGLAGLRTVAAKRMG